MAREFAKYEIEAILIIKICDNLTTLEAIKVLLGRNPTSLELMKFELSLSQARNGWVASLVRNNAQMRSDEARRSLTKVEVSEARKKGAEDFEAGFSDIGNPYDFGTQDYFDYQTGWEEACLKDEPFDRAKLSRECIEDSCEDCLNRAIDGEGCRCDCHKDFMQGLEELGKKADEMPEWKKKGWAILDDRKDD